MNSPVLVAVHPGLVTAIGPVVAPTGTVADMRMSESTVNVEAAAALNVAVVPVNPVPAIVTTVPTGPSAGSKELMVGTAAFYAD